MFGAITKGITTTQSAGTSPNHLFRKEKLIYLFQYKGLDLNRILMSVRMMGKILKFSINYIFLLSVILFNFKWKPSTFVCHFEGHFLQTVHHFHFSSVLAERRTSRLRPVVPLLQTKARHDIHFLQFYL